MSLGQFIKEQRLSRGLSQWELARLSGLGRSHLSRLELDDYKHPSAETFLALATALKVHPNDLYQAAGYVKNTRFRRGPPRALRRILAELEIAQPAIVPVATEIHTRVADVNQNACWAFPNNGSKRIRAFLVQGFSLKPQIKEGDVIFVDPEKTPSSGNVILCYEGDKVRLARHLVGKSNNGDMPGADCHICGVVVGVSKKLV
jgi:transcriptional regulator with XRE-family HTH domain